MAPHGECISRAIKQLSWLQIGVTFHVSSSFRIGSGLSNVGLRKDQQKVSLSAKMGLEPFIRRNYIKSCIFLVTTAALYWMFSSFLPPEGFRTASQEAK